MRLSIMARRGFKPVWSSLCVVTSPTEIMNAPFGMGASLGDGYSLPNGSFNFSLIFLVGLTLYLTLKAYSPGLVMASSLAILEFSGLIMMSTPLQLVDVNPPQSGQRSSSVIFLHLVQALRVIFTLPLLFFYPFKPSKSWLSHGEAYLYLSFLFKA